MDWDNSTEQGRRSLIAAFILTLLIAGPLVLLNDSDSDGDSGGDGGGMAPLSAMAGPLGVLD